MRRMITAGASSAVAVLLLLVVMQYSWTQEETPPPVAAETNLRPVADGQETGEEKTDTEISGTQESKKTILERAAVSVTLSPEEKALNREAALEQHNERAQGHRAYAAARKAWRRELNAARRSGDKSELRRIQAEEPDKKMFLAGQ